MCANKLIKDPIYGYIKIDSNIAHQVIDTGTFQRLRNIRQTSYAALYPSALHNRFVHSLGVYFLGSIAIHSFFDSVKNNNGKVKANKKVPLLEREDHYSILFKMACLLHDVGHSPFSHTGEEFYPKSKSIKKLKNSSEYSILTHLSELTNDGVFMSAAAASASPHEIMSSIVALEKFGDADWFDNDEDKSFFARCITGLLYEDGRVISNDEILNCDEIELNNKYKHMVLNCIISLLNSTLIDVDRLDYIIRDATTMGYKSVSIDYYRLLNSVEIIWTDDHNFSVGFHKNAISVIENAVYAHDNEKKWIQSHPIILYDSFLVNKSIEAIEEGIRKDYPKAESTLFGFDSLTEKGIVFENPEKNKSFCTSYLCDADIIFLIKNIYKSAYSLEYFNRDRRLKPLWKSEAEYKNLFDKSDREIMREAMDIIISRESGAVDNIEITEEVIDKFYVDYNEVEKDNNSKKKQLQRKRYLCAKKIQELCGKYGAENRVVLLRNSYFKSNFSKDSLREVPLYFPSGRKMSRLGDVAETLFSKTTHDDEKCVYLFYCMKDTTKTIIASHYCKELIEGLKEIMNNDT